MFWDRAGGLLTGFGRTARTAIVMLESHYGSRESVKHPATSGKRVQRVYLNGRFLTQRLTGVQRYAREVLFALDALLDEAPTAQTFCLIVPPGADKPKLKVIELEEAGPFHGNLWEQLTLPLRARDGLLWGFSPTGPLLKRDQCVTIHDGTLRAIPNAFSRPFRAWYDFAMPLLARRSAHVVTVSEFSRGEVIRFYGAAPSRLSVSGEGWQHALRETPDEAILQRHSLRPRRYILAVSSTTPHKNFALVEEAFKQFESDDIDIVIAGEAHSKIFGTVTEGSSRRTTHVGYVTEQELRALYENAGVFVFPSLYEGFGLPPLEAMACGCPVIASRAAAIPEVCGDGALYFDPHDATDLARNIERVMGDATIREELIGRGREQLERHSWRAAAQVHLAAIQSALAHIALRRWPTNPWAESTPYSRSRLETRCVIAGEWNDTPVSK